MNVQQTVAVADVATVMVATKKLADHAVKLALASAKLAGRDNVNYRLEQRREFLLLTRRLADLEQLMYPPDQRSRWICK